MYIFHVTVRTKKVNSFFFSFFSQLCTIGFAGRRARIFTRARAAPVILVRSNLFKVWESLFAHFYKRSSILSLSESGICLDPDHSLPKFHPPPPSFTQSIPPTPLPLSNGCLVLDQMPTGKLRKPVSVSWPLFFLLFCFFISSFLFFLFLCMQSLLGRQRGWECWNALVLVLVRLFREASTFRDVTVPAELKSFFSFFHILQIHLNLGGIQPSLCSFEVWRISLSTPSRT